MTPTQIINAVRNQLNAVGDNLWSDDEILTYVFRTEMELSRETQCIERTYTTTTVASQEDYSFPTTAQEIVRATYDGNKLKPIDRRMQDSISLVGTTQTGTPICYTQWEKTLSLYPIPDDALTLKLWTIDFPSLPTVSSTLDTPAEYHDVVLYGVLSSMVPKDVGHPLTSFWQGQWMNGLIEVKRHMKRRKRSDLGALVKTEETMISTFDLGMQ